MNKETFLHYLLNDITCNQVTRERRKEREDKDKEKQKNETT